MSCQMQLTDFDAVSFDCYGTLIDWEAGIGAVLGPWASAHGVTATSEELLERYAQIEARWEAEQPAALYPDILDAAMRSLGASLGVDVSAAESERLAEHGSPHRAGIVGSSWAVVPRARVVAL